jgi:hypothetical protein
MPKSFYVVSDMDMMNGEWFKVFRTGSFEKASEHSKKIELSINYDDRLPNEIRKYTMIERTF